MVAGIPNGTPDAIRTHDLQSRSLVLKILVIFQGFLKPLEIAIYLIFIYLEIFTFSFVLLGFNDQIMTKKKINYFSEYIHSDIYLTFVII